MATPAVDRPVWTLLALATAVVFILGCGEFFCTTPCDDFASRLVDECGIYDEEDEEVCKDDEACADGTYGACIAQCGLGAPCALFDGSLDPTDEQDLQVLLSYADCTAGC